MRNTIIQNIFPSKTLGFQASAQYKLFFWNSAYLSITSEILIGQTWEGDFSIKAMQFVFVKPEILLASWELSRLDARDKFRGEDT
jgi:hypothetical protein